MIKHIEVQNFKSLKDVRLRLGLRNFLVGPNLAGKSNLLEVFRFLYRSWFPPSGQHGLPNAFPGGFFEFTWKGGVSNLIHIALKVDLPSEIPTMWDEWSYSIKIVGDERGSVRVQEERLTLADVDGPHELIDNTSGFRSLRNTKGDIVYQNVETSRSALEFEATNWEGARLRLWALRWRFYHLFPRFMKQPNPTAAPIFLTEIGDNLSAWLMLLQTRYGESFERLKKAAMDVFPELEELFTWPTQQSTVLLATREKHLIRPGSVWQMSDGQLAFLALLSLIFAPEELGANLYCVEEPENCLHPRLQETLMELLTQVQDELGPERAGQVLATTHSPYLVDHLDLDDLIVVEKTEGATAFIRPADKGHLRDLLGGNEAALGDLYYSGALGNA